MQAYLEPNSVGIVTPRLIWFDESLTECERVLDGFELVVESYGTLNDDKSNAILICHALSGSHHAAGYHSPTDTKAGWWDTLIGKGKAIDTTQFFVVCLNNIGSCHGSTGPTTINPKTGKIWGQIFHSLPSKTGSKPKSCLLTVWALMNGTQSLGDRWGNASVAMVGGLSTPPQKSHCHRQHAQAIRPKYRL